MESLQEKLRDVVLEHTIKVSIIGALNLSEEKYDELKLETDLASDLGMDSLDAAEIIMRIEEDHDLEEIPEDYARKANTVKHIYDYVLKHCEKPLDKLLNFSDKNYFFKKLITRIAENAGLEVSDLEGVVGMDELKSKLGISDQ
ncbi:phosphopantetheine attachment site family protein [Neorickettsia helminthoeca str. Oregon]|uniref:Acyl carrier protein AcpXL n=1 Tax=Neorickettsia helminthoeca str. Oregon TaxID=1286528 RepID=X5H3U4_9RICK|nr:phosphopantetheine-binding protein [Neorickettsia helminthoeca]AHX11368.1 phosphopantetheine attachment site family protein [Neorickettsia helminthoeca str. Oregon]